MSWERIFKLSLEAFYNWCQETPIGVWLTTNTYPFPVIEAVHLLGITLLLGPLFTINLRVLGLGLKGRPLPEVVQGLRPWIWGGYVLTFATGIPLYMSEAIKLSGIVVWAPKMYALVGALLIQFILTVVLLKGGRVESGSGLAKVMAVLSMALFLATGFLARWIAFV